MTRIVEPADAPPAAPSAEPTLVDVRTYDFCAPAQSHASTVVARFERDPDLPGVIVEHAGEALGILSRQTCLECLSHPFGTALFRDAPIEKMFGGLPRAPMILAEDMPIQQAADRCLARPRERVYEPAIVVMADGRRHLLGMYDLIVAQSQCLARANCTIQQQIKVVEEASRAKGAFLANMSHEIRTPMNAIIGMTELVLGTELTSRQREYLEIVTEAGQTLMAIINDILDFSKIEAGKMSLDRTPFDLQKTIGDTVKSLAVRTYRQGLELAYRCALRVPEFVTGDAVRLRQVLFNLLGNAIKFTQEGEVVLEVDVEHEDADGLVLRCRVIDTGVGIPADKLSVVFEAFEQADTSTTRRFGGTGLGLAISSRLVKLMGGRLWAESEVGRGSVFSFTARFNAADDMAAARPGAPSDVARTRVLLVDDNRTNRRILAEMYAAWSMLPETASSAAEAVASLRTAAEGGSPFRLVVADVHMPGQNGFDLVESIRQDPRLAGTAALMLSSGDTAQDAGRCDRLKIAAYLLKPVTRSELLDATLAALGVAGSTGALAADRTEQPPVDLPPLVILVAEDNALNQKLLTEMLVEQGHSVTIASNGREAVARLADGKFDMVLMDVQMPDMDGLEVTGIIRRRELGTGRRVPIIAVTAHAMKDDRRRCIEAGMDEYVSKPIRSQALRAAMATALCRCQPPENISPRSPLKTPRHRKPLDGNRARPQPAAAEPATPAPASVDWDAALSIFEGNQSLLKLAAETFLEESDNLVDAVRQAIQRRDAGMLRIAAHSLKGALRYFGPTRAVNLASGLEQRSAAGSLEDAPAALDALQQSVVLVVDDVRRHLTEASLAAPAERT